MPIMRKNLENRKAMANRTEKPTGFVERNWKSVRKERKRKQKIPNITDELLDFIAINACQAKLVKLNYFD